MKLFLIKYKLILEAKHFVFIFLDFCEDGFKFVSVNHYCTSDVWKSFHNGKYSKALSACISNLFKLLLNFFYFGTGIGPSHV